MAWPQDSPADPLCLLGVAPWGSPLGLCPWTPILATPVRFHLHHPIPRCGLQAAWGGGAGNAHPPTPAAASTQRAEDQPPGFRPSQPLSLPLHTLPTPPPASPLAASLPLHTPRRPPLQTPSPSISPGSLSPLQPPSFTPPSPHLYSLPPPPHPQAPPSPLQLPLGSPFMPPPAPGLSAGPAQGVHRSPSSRFLGWPGACADCGTGTQGTHACTLPYSPIEPLPPGPWCVPLLPHLCSAEADAPGKLAGPVPAKDPGAPLCPLPLQP